MMNDIGQKPKTNIVLIGFMGTGKSSVGKRLAAELGFEFIDTDREIEKVTGLSIVQIFDQYGEVRFRSEETLMAKRVASMRRAVISTGGGIVLNQDNVTELKATGVLIQLSAHPSVVWSRVSRRTHRPLIKKDITEQMIAELMAARNPHYNCADYSVDTSEKSIIEVGEDIIGYLREREKQYSEKWLPEGIGMT